MDYRAKVRYVVDGTVQVSLVRLVSGVETSLGTVTVPGLAYAVGQTLQVRLNVVGSGTTTLQAKVWTFGTTEPASFQISRTDTTAGLQSAAGWALRPICPVRPRRRPRWRYSTVCPSSPSELTDST